MNTFNSDFFRGKLQGRMEAELQNRSPKPEVKIQRETVVVRDDRALAAKDAEINRLKSQMDEDLKISRAALNYAASLDTSLDDARYSGFLNAYTENHRFQLKKLVSEMLEARYAVPPLTESHIEVAKNSMAQMKKSLATVMSISKNYGDLISAEDVEKMSTDYNSIVSMHGLFFKARGEVASSFYRASDMLALVGPLIIDPPSDTLKNR